MTGRGCGNGSGVTSGALHEFMAERLGVGRTSVSERAGGLRPVLPYIVRLIQLIP